jgi:NADH:ubiquinone oxidoreductase subunit 5 (subunit L)/multisubunit Na+/H+ antiporter MnhA subunit
MMRCWTLTFWGKPRNPYLHEHARETPMLYIPLIVLAVAAVIGGKYLGVREMIETSQTEMNKQENVDLFATAWPSQKPENVIPVSAEAARGEAADEPGATHGNTDLAAAGGLGGQTGGLAAAARVRPLDTSDYLQAGERYLHTALAGGWAWLIALGLGFILYMNGYGLVNGLMKIPPVRWVHTWLYRRMYFDELYQFVFIGTVLFFSYLSAAFDRFVIDAVVNAVAMLCRRASTAVGWNDRYVVDGAVNGAASVAQSIGAAVRAPQTGRVRLYVTVLMCIIAVSIAGAIVVVLSQ